MPAKIFKYDLFGKRQEKLEFLDNHLASTIPWVELPPDSSLWVLEGEGRSEYEQGFSVANLFPVNSVGVVTARDGMLIQFKKENVEKVLNDFLNLPVEELRTKYKLGKDARDWKIDLAKKDVKSGFNLEKIVPIAYRPFDIRYSYYTGHSKGFHCMPRGEVMKHFLLGENVGLVTSRQVKAGETWQHLLITNLISESSLSSNKTGEISQILPLYLYSEDGHKTPNLNPETIKNFFEKTGMQLDWEAPLFVSLNPAGTSLNPDGIQYTPQDLLDYIYSSLHSPSYRQKFAEFLKKDFPRVPYPKTKTEFWRLVSLGKKLRELHLMTSPEADNLITTYPASGDDMVEKVSFVLSENLATNEDSAIGDVYINSSQYFGKVPKIAWEFYIGGYQPAQKYLKDRKGRSLTSEEIEHYQKIITVLTETEKLMKEIG